MDKGKILDWMLVPIWFVLILLVIDASLWFGSTSYFVLSGVITLTGIVGMALSLACHDGLKSHRFAYSAVVFVGGAAFTALPFA